MKILFTGGGGAGCEAIYRILGDTYDLHFADADINAINTLIPVERRHAIPMASNPEFIDKIIYIYDQLSIDLLIPGVDEELPILGKLSHINVLLPDIDYINTMLDKYKCNKILKKLNIDAPDTILVKDYKNINWMYFPCIAKPRSGRGSRNVFVINSAEQINGYISLTGLKKHEVVLQEKAVGIEYTVLMAADSKARLHAVVPVMVEDKKGITISAITDNNLLVENACKKIHSKLPTCGCYNIQLILTHSGMVMPFEINPRVSTTFCLSLEAGVNPIDIYLSKNPIKKILKYKIGLKLRRYWINSFS